MLRTPEEDQKLLDEKIAPTEKIWDSLSTILRRKDLEESYRDSKQGLFKTEQRTTRRNLSKVHTGKPKFNGIYREFERIQIHMGERKNEKTV